MYEIKMPRLGVNDDAVTLVKWLINDGEYVTEDQVIAEIETSKEASEIISDFCGIITLLAKEGDDVAIGEPVATISPGEKSASKPQVLADISENRMTEKAKMLVEKYQINLSLLPTDRLIREKDILPFIPNPYVLTGTKNNDIILYGGGGFTRIAIDILKVTHAYHTYGVVDMKYPELKDVMGVPVIGDDAKLSELIDNGHNKIFNGVGAKGSQYWRKPPYEKLKKYGFEFPNIIHAKAVLEPTVSMGEGVLICAGAIIGAMAQIGNNCVLNAGCIISHDCIVSDNCHIASGAVLAGIVTVGENTLIGQNVTVYSRVKIGSNVIIENGCCIFKNVPDNTVVRYGVIK